MCIIALTVRRDTSTQLRGKLFTFYREKVLLDGCEIFETLKLLPQARDIKAKTFHATLTITRKVMARVSR